MADAYSTSDGTVDRELRVGRGSDDNETFGDLLKRSRLDAGLSAKQLAERADVDPTFVRAIERGTQSPSTETARKLFASTTTDVQLAGHVPAPLGADLVIKDPGDDQLVYVQFKASKRGENNRLVRVASTHDDQSQQDSDAMLASIVRRVATADRSTLARLSDILDHLGVAGR